MHIETVHKRTPEGPNGRGIQDPGKRIVNGSYTDWAEVSNGKEAGGWSKVQAWVIHTYQYYPDRDWGRLDQEAEQEVDVLKSEANKIIPTGERKREEKSNEDRLIFRGKQEAERDIMGLDIAASQAGTDKNHHITSK